MTTLTVTTKGQVTLKKEVLSHMGVKPGDKIEVEICAGGRTMLKAAARSGSLDDFIGCVEDRDGPVLTQAEIKAAIADAWARRK